MATLLYHLAKNPTKQELLRNEIKEILLNIESQLGPDSLNRIPYLRACIKESMRIQPVAEASVRGTGKDIVLCGYQIPKNVFYFVLFKKNIN